MDMNIKMLESLKACVASLEGFRREMALIGIGASNQPCDAEKLAVEVISAAESNPAVPVQLTDEQVEKVDNALCESIGSAYDCLRVWGAWSYGTMGPDDFALVTEDGERVAEIRNSVLMALGYTVEG